MLDLKKQLVKTCPYCGSDEIRKEKLSPRVFAIGILLFGFPLPFLVNKYHCFDCSKDFRQKDLIKTTD